jgi:hypothetical protein
VLCWCDCLDDDQLAAATRAWQREGAGWLIGIMRRPHADLEEKHELRDGTSARQINCRRNII